MPSLYLDESSSTNLSSDEHSPISETNINNNNNKMTTNTGLNRLNQNKFVCIDFPVGKSINESNTTNNNKRIMNSKESITNLNRFHSFRFADKLVNIEEPNLTLNSNLSKSFLDLSQTGTTPVTVTSDEKMKKSTSNSTRNKCEITKSKTIDQLKTNPINDLKFNRLKTATVVISLQKNKDLNKIKKTKTDKLVISKEEDDDDDDDDIENENEFSSSLNEKTPKSIEPAVVNSLSLINSKKSAVVAANPSLFAASSSLTGIFNNNNNSNSNNNIKNSNIKFLESSITALSQARKQMVVGPKLFNDNLIKIQDASTNKENQLKRIDNTNYLHLDSLSSIDITLNKKKLNNNNNTNQSSLLLLLNKNNNNTTITTTPTSNNNNNNCINLSDESISDLIIDQAKCPDINNNNNDKIDSEVTRKELENKRERCDSGVGGSLTREIK